MGSFIRLLPFLCRHRPFGMERPSHFLFFYVSLSILHLLLHILGTGGSHPSGGRTVAAVLQDPLPGLEEPVGRMGRRSSCAGPHPGEFGPAAGTERSVRGLHASPGWRVPGGGRCRVCGRWLVGCSLPGRGVLGLVRFQCGGGGGGSVIGRRWGGLFDSDARRGRPGLYPGGGSIVSVSRTVGIPSQL